MVKKILLIVVFVTLLVISRVYNLEKTARFIWDESSDLVNIHQTFVEKNLTLIGPISEDGSKVFGSLTYYMLMPFAVIGNFDPISTAYGAAFWGVLTGILLVYLISLINKKLVIFSLPIAILWYPLAETGRWAWNPNLIPFWSVLSIIFLLKKKPVYLFLSGLAIGMTIHLHYLSVFAALALGIIILIESIHRKKLTNAYTFFAGLALAVLPFVLFDLTHPPGLFLSRILYFNNIGGAGTLNLWQRIMQIIGDTFYYFTQSNVLILTLLGGTLLLVIFDIKNKSRALAYLFVFIAQLAGLVFIKNFYIHYIIPGLIFYIVYLFYPRIGFAKKLSLLSISVLIISGIFSFPKQVSRVTWESDIASTKRITNTIESEIRAKDMKNVNIAVLGSPDPNTYGRRYRDLLLIDNIPLKDKGEYQISDSLFVISTSDLDRLRADPSYEMSYFKKGKLVNEWTIEDSTWKVYLLSKSL